MGIPAERFAVPGTFVIRRGVFSLGGVRSIRAGQVVAPGKRCLEDSLLLSIGRGEISDPALSHFLLHLGQCGQCCVRSDELIRKNPNKMLSTLAKLAPRLEKTPPPGAVPSLDKDGIDWIGLARSMRPKLQLPRLECPPRAGELPTFGPYQIEGTLGEGASSVVYKALDPELGRTVALKVLRPDVAAREGMAETFLAEARALAKVKSPNLVTLLTYGKTPAPHLTMELLEGRSLAERLESGPIPEREAMRLLLDLARGLKALHAGGLVHRDIKPANVWLSPSPDRPGQDRAVLMDLGLAGNRSLAAGTPGYQAPELLGQVPPTPASDIFSLGTLLRVMALGADKGEETQGPAPARLDPLIYKMMDPNPERRPTAAEVVTLAEAQVGRKGPLKRALVPALLAVMVLLGAGLAWLTQLENGSAVNQTVNTPSEPEPQGLRPDRVLKRVFRPGALAGLRDFQRIGGRYCILNQQELRFEGDGPAAVAAPPFPGEVDHQVLRDGVLAFSTSRGEIFVRDLSADGNWQPVGQALIDSSKDQVISLDLSAREDGKLLIHCGKMVYLMQRVDGQFSGKLRALCQPNKFLQATGGTALMRLAFAEDPRNIIAFSQRGGLVCTRLETMECVWGFRPTHSGPQLVVPRPGVPGAFALGSPSSCFGVFGPGIKNEKALAPEPERDTAAGLKAPVIQIDWLDKDRLIVLESGAENSLFLAEYDQGTMINDLLAVRSVLRFYVDRATATVHCLRTNGDVAVWELAKKPAQ